MGTIKEHVWKPIPRYETLNARQSLHVMMDDSSSQVRSKDIEFVFTSETMC